MIFLLSKHRDTWKQDHQGTAQTQKLGDSHFFFSLKTLFPNQRMQNFSMLTFFKVTYSMSSSCVFDKKKPTHHRGGMLPFADSPGDYDNYPSSSSSSTPPPCCR